MNHYIDIGALQHKNGGGDAFNTSYPDIGALQTADTIGSSLIKFISGVAIANVKSVGGVAIASVKKVSGVTNT